MYFTGDQVFDAAKIEKKNFLVKGYLDRVNVPSCHACDHNLPAQKLAPKSWIMSEQKNYTSTKHTAFTRPICQDVIIIRHKNKERL
jgi:hypothetical protein